MKAIVLLSGGIDSAVVLALALEAKKNCIALSFDYGQRHRIELSYAKELASHFGVGHRLIKIDTTAFAKTSLIGAVEVPKNRDLATIATSGIPSTYVPARNTLFLAFALAQAELLDATEIHAGPNLLDQKPYPDCRPEFYKAFQGLMNVATKQAIEGHPPQLLTPLIHLDKRAIVQEAIRLQIPLEKTFSCYSPTPNGKPCNTCDACAIRRDAIS